MIAQADLKLPELVESLDLVSAPVNSGLHWGWYLVGVVALLALVIPLYLAFRPRSGKGDSPVRPTAPDPAIVAIKRLNHLKKAMANMSQREAAIELASILRDYISGRFDIRAPYQTTGEFVRHLNLTAHFPSKQTAPVVDLLNTFDLVKFATGILREGTLEQWISYVMEFVNNTQRRVPADESKTGEGQMHG